jgi:uncharacterized protein YcfL
MRSIRVLPLAAMLLVTTLVFGGCSSSASKKPTAEPSRPVAGANTHALIYSINSDSPNFRAVLSGAIGDYGPAVAVVSNGQMELQLTHGTFRLDIAELTTMFGEQTKNEPTYPNTCSDHFGVTTNTPIVADSGTGAYAGVTGAFTLTLTGDEVQANPCSGNSLAMVSQVIMIAGPGAVSVRG